MQRCPTAGCGHGTIAASGVISIWTSWRMPSSPSKLESKTTSRPPTVAYSPQCVAFMPASSFCIRKPSVASHPQPAMKSSSRQRFFRSVTHRGRSPYIGDGKKTVDVQQIKERFAGLNIATDWTRFDRITNVRNEVEHYYTKTSKKALQGLVADAFVVTRNFLATQLQEDPLELLGDETWQIMLEVADVHAAERAECVAALKAFPWDSGVVEQGVLEITCGACSSDLIRPASTETAFNYDMILECRACGQTTTAESFVPEAVKSVLAGAMYLSHTDGDETPYTTCPECAAEAYIMEDECCALCGESAEHTCARCGCSIPASELGSSLCGYCDHMMSKDD